MALFPKTPGVFIEEIPRFPSSVAAVPTSVPVFIGYTKQVVVDGNTITSFPTNPIRIESLLQYETIFGGPFSEIFEAVLSGTAVNIEIDQLTASGKDFRLYYNLLMYFGNGGGPCYIVSTGLYSSTTITSVTSSTVLANAIAKAEQVDEVTMVLVPDAMAVEFIDVDHLKINNAILAHCSKMQDRFGLIDVRTDTSMTIAQDSAEFRDDAIGANNLSYGAAYYPSYKPSFPFSYIDTDVNIDASAVNLPASVQAYDNKSLAVVNSGVVRTVDLAVLTPSVAANLQITIPGFALQTIAVPVVGPAPADDAAALAILINNNPIVNAHLSASNTTGSNIVKLTATSASTSSNNITIVSSVVARLTVTSVTVGLNPDKVLYNRITGQLNSFAIELYPSSMMAGIYCAVDTARGVWKAPANVGVNLVDRLNRNVKDSDQEDLNVDATSGKSIDVIRKFDGRGILVWGARTLDGNSNEWRYISVRRTFLFIEDSCKKATMFSVFEPNDANTWLRIQGMISSFLTTLWRDGALAGSKPEQAFFVKVGLGQTMTAQDILEGRLIVQIGLAVVRPAEFIILQFEHKLQEA